MGSGTRCHPWTCCLCLCMCCLSLGRRFGNLLGEWQLGDLHQGPGTTRGYGVHVQTWQWGGGLGSMFLPGGSRSLCHVVPGVTCRNVACGKHWAGLVASPLSHIIPSSTFGAMQGWSCCSQLLPWARVPLGTGARARLTFALLGTVPASGMSPCL